jgi:hypothetical protein
MRRKKSKNEMAERGKNIILNGERGKNIIFGYKIWTINDMEIAYN